MSGLDKSRAGASRAACMLAVIASVGSARANDDEGTIKDYLYALGAGPLAANQIIQLDRSAVTNIQTAKDLVLALGGLGDDKAKDGFGIAFTPGRSNLGALAVSLARYADRKDPLGRIWGNTTFSYAQNKLDKGGTSYERSAWAVNVSAYLHPDDDPVVAARNAIVFDLQRGGACAPAIHAVFTSHANLLAAGRRIKEAMKLDPDKDTLPKNVKDWLGAQVNPGSPPVELQPMLADLLPRILEEQARAGATVADPARLAAELQACADKARDAAKKKWNASQITLVLGEGSIRAAAGDRRRASLGRYATLGLAWAPREDDRNLLNLTLRRIGREVDLDTLSTTPAFKDTSIVAARYTYGQPGRSTYALAEVSNVKANKGTLSSAAYKHAIGIDHKLTGGLWLEFRYGRARTVDGTKLENKALLNLKFSPESTLDKDQK